MRGELHIYTLGYIEGHNAIVSYAPAEISWCALLDWPPCRCRPDEVSYIFCSSFLDGHHA